MLQNHIGRLWNRGRGESMKRNCNHCTALQKDISGIGRKCSLGHKIQPTKEVLGLAIEYKPLGNCEKPKTLMELARCQLGK